MVVEIDGCCVEVLLLVDFVLFNGGGCDLVGVIWCKFKLCKWGVYIGVVVFGDVVIVFM